MRSAEDGEVGRKNKVYFSWHVQKREVSGRKCVRYLPGSKLSFSLIIWRFYLLKSSIAKAKDGFALDHDNRRHRSSQAPTCCELGKPCISDHLQAPSSPMFVVLLSCRASVSLNQPHWKALGFLPDKATSGMPGVTWKAAFGFTGLIK